MKSIKYFCVACTVFSLLSAEENNKVHQEKSDKYSEHREDREFIMEVFPIQDIGDSSWPLIYLDNHPGILPSRNERYHLEFDPNFIDDGVLFNDDIPNRANLSAANCLIDSIYGAHSACGPINFIYGYHIDRHKDDVEVEDVKKHLYNLYVIVENNDKPPNLDIDVWDFTLPYYVIITPQGIEKYDEKHIDDASHTYCLYYSSGMEFIEHEKTIDHIFHLIKNEPIIITQEQALSLRKRHDEKLIRHHDEDDICDGAVNVYHIYDVAPQGEINELTLIDQCEIVDLHGKVKHIYHLDKRMRGFHFDPLGILEDQELLKIMNQFFFLYSYACYPMFGFDEGGGGMGGGIGGIGTGGSTGFSFGMEGGGSGGSGGSGNDHTDNNGNETTTGTTTGTTTATTGTTVTDSAGRETTVNTDNGHITVPEPSTYLILGAGLLIIAYIRYMSKKRVKDSSKK